MLASLTLWHIPCIRQPEEKKMKIVDILQRISTTI